jgi:hypothetical protein
MQNVMSAPVIERPILAIRLESAAYLALLGLALVLRLAALGEIPMSESEIPAALAAYRAVIPSGEALTASSPILFGLQGLAFSTINGAEFGARLFTALGGALLVLTPLLFRRELGSTRTFVCAALLLLSPVELVASRFSAPVVWSMIFAVILVWSLLRLREPTLWLRALATSSGAGLIFLSEAGGIVLAAILIGAGVVTTLWERGARRFSFDDAESSGDHPAAPFMQPGDRLSGWGIPLIVAATFVILIGTGALLYPPGLAIIGETLAGFARGFTTALEGSIAPFPLYTSIFYEPFWWGLGIAGIIVLIYRGTLTLIDRFLIGWVVFAVLAALVWVGGEAHHALWFTMPLIALTSSAVMAMLTPLRRTDVFAPPAWARWIVAFACIAVLIVFTVSFQALARSTLSSSSELISSFTPNANSVILVLVSIMFMVIGFFLIASVWGDKTALQGIGLGVLIFGALTSFGSGWGAAVSGSENPREPFHFQATSLDVALLRETLRDLAERNSGGFNAMPLTIMAEQDGIVAWEARDFTQAEFIGDLRDAYGDPIVLLPQFEEPPVLGGSYVGQDFIIRRLWSPLGIYLIDYPAWWMQRHARFGWLSLETVVLWLRQDVYNGQMQEEATG